MNDEDGKPAIGSKLEFLWEPALIVDLNGQILHANAAARVLLGADIAPDALRRAAADDWPRIQTYLRAATASTAPRVGSLRLCLRGVTRLFRVHAALLPPDMSGKKSVILRIMPPKDDQFAAMNRRVQNLNVHLHRRLKENALLKQALEENKVLLSELQHRVKNNVQQMLSLIKMSASRQASPQHGDFIRTASDRLMAMAKTQEAIYQSGRAEGLAASALLEDIARAANASYGSVTQIRPSIKPVIMTADEAHCLALIVNELVTNACKHAASPGSCIDVVVSAEEGRICLEVRDQGPGFDETAVPRSSGLNLVRNLCRQLDATFEIENDYGATCRVAFRSKLTSCIA